MSTLFAVPAAPDITVGETYEIHDDPTGEPVIVTRVWWRSEHPRAWFVDVLRLSGKVETYNPGALYRPKR